MKILCPKCNPDRQTAGKPLVWQPAKLRYWCKACGRHFTLQEAAIVPKAAPEVKLGFVDLSSWGGWT